MRICTGDGDDLVAIIFETFKDTAKEGNKKKQGIYSFKCLK